LDYLKLALEGKKAGGRGLPKIKVALLSDAATQLLVPLFRALFPGLRGTGGGSRAVRGYNARWNPPRVFWWINLKTWLNCTDPAGGPFI